MALSGIPALGFLPSNPITNGGMAAIVQAANILFTREGTAKICDFGVARAPTNVAITVGSTALGTIAYMSPEQARGEPVDARSDL